MLEEFGSRLKLSKNKITEVIASRQAGQGRKVPSSTLIRSGYQTISPTTAIATGIWGSPVSENVSKALAAVPSEVF
jgi:hypothetical protein